jgi:hypothetical protein
MFLAIAKQFFTSLSLHDGTLEILFIRKVNNVHLLFSRKFRYVTPSFVSIKIDFRKHKNDGKRSDQNKRRKSAVEISPGCSSLTHVCAPAVVKFSVGGRHSLIVFNPAEVI